MTTAIPRGEESGAHREVAHRGPAVAMRPSAASDPRREAWIESFTEELVAMHRLAESGLTPCEIARLVALRDRFRRV